MNYIEKFYVKISFKVKFSVINIYLYSNKYVGLMYSLSLIIEDVSIISIISKSVYYLNFSFSLIHTSIT